MKTIKLNYACIHEGFDKEHNLIYDALKRNGYDVQITEDADYLVCDMSAPDDHNPYAYCGKPQVRILHSGENYIPDFNLVDYGISPYPVQFGDRHFQMPPYTWKWDQWHGLASKDRNYTMEFVQSKEYFANFISSHESEFGIRGGFFKKLCAEYKRVESIGTYLNNMPDGRTVSWLDNSKTDFQRKCKFTLCFESTFHYGFVTEKLMDAFYADTIPIYYGTHAAAEVFNKDAFINAADYDSFEAVLEKIKELDQDDEKYLAMLRQPILVDPELPARMDRELEQFILHIFEQPLDKAYRRSRVFFPKQCDSYLARAVDSDLLTVRELILRLVKKVAGKLTGK